MHGILAIFIFQGYFLLYVINACSLVLFASEILLWILVNLGKLKNLAGATAADAVCLSICFPRKRETAISNILRDQGIASFA